MYLLCVKPYLIFTTLLKGSPTCLSIREHIIELYRFSCLLFSWKQTFRSNYIWNVMFQVEHQPFLSHAGVCWWTLCLQCCQDKDTFDRTEEKKGTLILGPGFCKAEKNGVSLKQKTQSGHGMEMINCELHYWKASLIRCSHLPGEPAQHWRPGSHCCFFINKFPHNASAEETTPLGAPRQEDGCFKTPMRSPINPACSLFGLSIKA